MDDTTRKIHEFLDDIAVDIVRLSAKDWLLPALKSHTRHAFPKLNGVGVDRTVDEWFDGLAEWR